MKVGEGIDVEVDIGDFGTGLHSNEWKKRVNMALEEPLGVFVQRPFPNSFVQTEISGRLVVHVELVRDQFGPPDQLVEIAESINAGFLDNFASAL